MKYKGLKRKYGVYRKCTKMFAGVKKTSSYHYRQIVENHREGKKTIQRVIATVVRLDQTQARGEVESIVRSLFSSCGLDVPIWATLF